MVYSDGAERYRRNRRLKIKDRAIHIVDPIYVDRVCKLGEIWQAKLHPTWTYVDSESPDGGYDYILPSGKRVDQKLSFEHSNNLIAPKGYVFRADYYTLVTGRSEDDFVERGWATRAEFISAPLRDLKRGVLSYIIEQRYLHPMSEFPE